MAAELFGLALAPLYFAIAQVESDNGLDPMAKGNVYQIRQIYIDDLNRIYTYHREWRRTVSDRVASEHAMFDYWRWYGYKYAKETGKPVTYEVLAKIHNRGGRYWKKDAATQRKADEYWHKVLKVLKEKGYDAKTSGKMGSRAHRTNR